MKVSILSLTICLPTQQIIEYFTEKGFEIHSVIIEKNFRKKFSESEKKFRQAHDKFNRKTKKYPLMRRIARRFWDLMPFGVKKYVFLNIYHLPLVNKFSLKRYCEKRGIQVYEVSKHSSEETKSILLNEKIDYLLMVSSNWLLKEPIISLENTKIINAHSGWLPKHKGLDSIPWSVKEKDKIGLTTHFIDSGIDSGAILRFYEVKIQKGDTLNTIYNKVGALQPYAFYDTLKGLEAGKIEPKIQDGKIKPHKPMSYEMLMEVNNMLMHG